jgi:hypothetical protein
VGDSRSRGRRPNDGTGRGPLPECAGQIRRSSCVGGCVGHHDHTPDAAQDTCDHDPLIDRAADHHIHGATEHDESKHQHHHHQGLQAAEQVGEALDEVLDIVYLRRQVGFWWKDDDLPHHQADQGLDRSFCHRHDHHDHRADRSVAGSAAVPDNDHDDDDHHDDDDGTGDHDDNQAEAAADHHHDDDGTADHDHDGAADHDHDD